VVPRICSPSTGKGVEVLSASWVPSKWRPAGGAVIDQKDLKRIMIRNGQAGRSTRTGWQYLLKEPGASP